MSAFRFLLVLSVLAASYPTAASAQFFRRGGRISAPSGYVEMGCDCRHCVANRGGTYAEMYRQFEKSETVVVPKKDPNAPSPTDVIKAALEAIDLKPHDILLDVGCGDGRVLRAGLRAGCSVVGIDIDGEQVLASLSRLQDSGESPSKWSVIHGDATKLDLSAGTAVYLNLYPDVLAKVVPRLTGATRIVSYLHPIPGFDNVRIDTEHGPLYIVGWRELAAAANGSAAAPPPKVTKTLPKATVRVCRT